uniref:Uncharacterized protein n=1 Tax=Cynoglossus semilaevis TaxID=244447 RepID=A0A3P8USL1_CYNSE
MRGPEVFCLRQKNDILFAYFLFALTSLLTSVPAQDFYIECLGFDFLMVQNLVLQCRGPVQQACYTRDTGEKGCTPLRNCVKRGWSCCKTNRCNA